eukprot:UN03192
MSYFQPHNCIKTVATTTNLCRIIQFRPQNFQEVKVQAKAFAFHPSVYHPYIGSFLSMAFFTALIGKYTPNMSKNSDTLHRNIFRENYKRVHGHYNH